MVEHNLKSVLVIIVLLGLVVGMALVLGRGASLTGSAVAKTVACYTDSDCDDRISATDDTCQNAGTDSALCFNRPKN